MYGLPRIRRTLAGPLLAALLAFGACSAPPARPASAAPVLAAGAPADSSILLLPLAGPVAGDSAELSGLAWAGDSLLLLPQYPERFRQPSDDGALFWLSRAEVERAVAEARAGGSVTPLVPRRLPVHAPGVRERVPGYEGFEALVVNGTLAYLTIESTTLQGTGAFLASATLANGALRVDSILPAPIRPRPGGVREAWRRRNFGEEALLLSGDSLLSFYETNGVAFGAHPSAVLFGAGMQRLGSVPMLNLEYRVTDATAPDAEGRFWVLNYFWPGDTVLRAPGDPLAVAAGRTPDPAQRLPVERLVELQLTPAGIRFSGRPPRYLAPPRSPVRSPAESSYNFEGLARLGAHGLLLVTDEHPRTVLGFVEVG